MYVLRKIHVAYYIQDLEDSQSVGSGSREALEKMWHGKPHLILEVLGLEPRASCVRQCSTKELQSLELFSESTGSRLGRGGGKATLNKNNDQMTFVQKAFEIFPTPRDELKKNKPTPINVSILAP